MEKTTKKYPTICICQLVIALAMLLPLPLKAGREADAQSILMRSLGLLQHPNGSSFDYQMKLTRFFTQSGSLILKGKKTYGKSKKNTMWSDGTTTWKLSPDESEVVVYRTADLKRKPLGELLDEVRHNCKYNLEKSQEGTYLVHVRSLDMKSDIREATVLIDARSFVPKQFRMKVGLVWVLVDIQNFRTGNYPDSFFQYQPKEHPRAKIVDRR